LLASLSPAFICTTENFAAASMPSDSAGIEAKLVELRKSVAAATTPERTREVLSDVLPLIDESLGVDEYTLAIRVANLAVEAAGKIGSPHVAAVCESRKREVMSIGKEAKRLATQFEKLEKKPLDRGPNFEIGRFKCVFCNDWEHGLPLLAGGNNAAWNAIAKRDLENPADAVSQVGLAANWGRRAAGEKGPGKLALSQRARHWWRRAMSETTGAAREKIVGAVQQLPICYLTDLDT
jgi:hypothetical protein